jgi:hypothetical protein
VDPRSREALAAWGVRSLPPMLLNEVQKQQRTIGTLRAQVAAADEQTRARDEQVRTLTEQMAALTRAVAALSDRKQSRGWRRRIRVPGRRRSPVGRPPRRVLGLEGSSPQYGGSAFAYAGLPSRSLGQTRDLRVREALAGDPVQRRRARRSLCRDDGPPAARLAQLGACVAPPEPTVGPGPLGSPSPASWVFRELPHGCPTGVAARGTVWRRVRRKCMKEIEAKGVRLRGVAAHGGPRAASARQPSPAKTRWFTQP